MFPTIPLEAKEILPEISLEQFEDINDVELTCIFAESGMDRELDFDREAEVEKLYYNGQFPQLIRTRVDTNTILDDIERYQGINYDECKGY